MVTESTRKKDDDIEKEVTIYGKECAVVLYLWGGRNNEEGLYTRDIGEEIWKNMDKVKSRPTPLWLKNRVMWRLKHLCDLGICTVSNGALHHRGKKNIWNLTESGEDYAKFHYENNFEDLKVGENPRHS